MSSSAVARRRRPGRSPAPVALSGTPGTGKSSVARHLVGRWAVAEVGALALQRRSGRRRAGGTVVDLDRLARQLRSDDPPAPTVVVGHLAHLLPIRDVVILRCHPLRLAERLARARRGSPSDRRANVEAEATDVVLVEALQLGRRVWEVDTTDRTVEDVAREVGRLIARRPRARFGRIDWLADPQVTAYLLRPPPYPRRWSRRGTGPASSRMSSGSHGRSSGGRRTA